MKLRNAKINGWFCVNAQHHFWVCIWNWISLSLRLPNTPFGGISNFLFPEFQKFKFWCPMWVYKYSFFFFARVSNSKFHSFTEFSLLHFADAKQTRKSKALNMKSGNFQRWNGWVLSNIASWQMKFLALLHLVSIILIMRHIQTKVGFD